jgi:hypothetical protein
MKGRDYMGDLVVDGRIVLKLISNEICGCGLDSCDLG